MPGFAFHASAHRIQEVISRLEWRNPSQVNGWLPFQGKTIFLSCQFWWLSNLVKLDSDRHICLGLSHACVIWVQLTCSFQTLSGIGSVYMDDVSDWWLERNKAIRQGPELTHCSLLHCLIAWQFCPCVCFQSAVSLTHFWVRQQSPILTSVGDDPRRLLIFCT
jgi:hypothetical protein